MHAGGQEHGAKSAEFGTSRHVGSIKQEKYTFLVHQTPVLGGCTTFVTKFNGTGTVLVFWEFCAGRSMGHWISSCLSAPSGPHVPEEEYPHNACVGADTESVDVEGVGRVWGGGGGGGVMRLPAHCDGTIHSTEGFGDTVGER